ncbi:MAG: hypothetical protein R6X34_24345 [Chloroflexota bacterium]
MNDTEQSSAPTVNGNGINGVMNDHLALADSASIPVENEGPMVIEGSAVTVTRADVVQSAPMEISGQDIKEMADEIADMMTNPETAVSFEDDPDFDRLHAITRFLIGGAIEGTVEFTERLKIWESFIREELPLVSPTDLENLPERDLLRYALIGFVFEGEDTSRRVLKKLLKAPGQVAKTAVRTTKPITSSRFAAPVQRRIDGMAARGEEQILRWIQRGQAEEPLSRNIARLGVQEIVDEFINQLAQNEEVQTLVQEQGVGLAGEVVDQVRERTFTADTLVERIARAVTRRDPRVAPPKADLSEYPKNIPGWIEGESS